MSAHDYKKAYETKGGIIPHTCTECVNSFLVKRSLFLRQTHSTDGLILDEKPDEKLQAFAREGDFLITNQPGIGLGILTADCLPLVMYDPTKHIIALVHAGWRGSVAGIAITALQAMKNRFDSKPEQLHIFFGPAAKSCCYAIDEKIIGQLAHFNESEKYLICRNNQYYFDLANFNRALLEKANIKPTGFHMCYNSCTICNQSFYSYRRQKALSGRQITMAALK